MKATYVDGFVLCIPKKKTAVYKKIATEAKQVWRKFGALDYKECIINDATPPHVVMTFAKMAKAKPTEAVWFSFITFKSRSHRDQVNKNVMAYFDKKYGPNGMSEMPFDMKRFAYGGFKVEVGS
jgi:uncharacterized protein YbaA (DUF1428 family)